MKAESPPSMTWPFEFEVTTTSEGLLLKPRRKPRSGWAEAFRQPKSSVDELSDAREARNKFDAEEWKW